MKVCTAGQWVPRINCSGREAKNGEQGPQAECPPSMQAADADPIPLVLCTEGSTSFSPGLLRVPVSIVRVFGTNGSLNQERVWPILLVSLCGALSVLQASRFDCLSFDPFSLF